ncbi:MAG: SsrA-binding protein SmpB [Deltaproteobacteria bacterium]|jgi:SsrA-binding protein|nr:SsrA-binding protein SmpB [Deltaproteobacteria bacterium]
MNIKVVCQNKKAYHDYFIDEAFEAGMVLLGPEVKSLRGGRANLVDGYAKVKNGEVYLYNMHITPYPYAHFLNLDPKRTRKLLFHKREIRRLLGKTKEKGYALIPLKIYFKEGMAKIEIGLAKGKKLYDKRHALKEKELKREMDQVKKRRL